MARKAAWHIVIFCPAYNAAGSMAELVRRMAAVGRQLPQFGAKLDAMIVVDDGSKDGTLPVLRSLRPLAPFLRIVHKKKNGGAAAAVLDGMKQAARLIRAGKFPPENTVVVRMDADLEHQPEDLPSLLAPIIRGKADAAVGYIPFDRRSGMMVSWFNRAIGNAESSEFLGQGIPQFCPGFNAIRADALSKMHPRLLALSEKFKSEHKTEMLTVDFIVLALARSMGMKIAAVELSPIEAGRIKRQPIGKLLRYVSYHKKTVKFLRENL